MELSLQTRTVADHTVLEVGGEIDVYTAPRLKERLLELVADGTRHIVVDLQGVEFLDSTGLGVLVGGLRRVRAQGGHLALVCTQERILKIFRITGLATFFDIHPSVASAVQAAPAGLPEGDATPGRPATAADPQPGGNGTAPGTPSPPPDDGSTPGSAPPASGS